MSSNRSARLSDPIERRTHIRLRDLSIQNLLAAVLSLQIALWATMGLNALGISIPIVQPLIGFIYLTFAPGILTLTALRMRNLNAAEIAVYAVGLSVAIVQSIGFVINFFLTASSVKPFSFLAVTGAVSFFVLLLCAIAYYRNRAHPKPLFTSEMSAPLAPTLLLCILPFLAVFSTLLVNNYNASGGQLFLWLIIGLLVLLIAFDKVVPSKLYPLAVFVIALTLLFQWTLISAWFTGAVADVQSELWLAQTVLNTGIWNPTLVPQYNGMLSIVTLAPIYSLILNLGLVWVFKIVYSCIFALVPVALYQIFRRQLNEKVAFLACFFFVSFATFYMGMPGLARQEIAELFFALMILLLVSEEMNGRIRSALFVTFGLSLVVSHYALSYIAIFFFFFVWLVPTAARVRGSKLTLRHSRAKIGTRGDKQTAAPSPQPPPSPVTLASLSILFIASTAWYFYTAQSLVTLQFVELIRHMAVSISDLYNPTYSEALYVVKEGPKPGILHRVNSYINYLNLIFVVAGVSIAVLLKKHRLRLKASYLVLSVIAFAFLVASVVLPYLGGELDWQRVYQITLITLAPFLAIGFIKIGEAGGVTRRKLATKFGFGTSARVNHSHAIRLLAVYLVFFMLLSTGFFFAVTEGYRNFALSNQIDGSYSRQTVVGASWQAAHIGNIPLSGRYVTIFHYFNSTRVNSTRDNDTTLRTNSDGQITFTQAFYSPGQYAYYAMFDGDIYKPSRSDVVNVNVGGNLSSSQAISQATTNVYSTAQTITTLSASNTTPEVGQAVTFTATLSTRQLVYVDSYNIFLLGGALGLGEQAQMPFYLQDSIAGGSNVFLGTYNIEHNRASLFNVVGVNYLERYVAPLTPFISNRSLIYSNGGANVYSYDMDYAPRITITDLRPA
jgi:uncharacterized membrane protein